MLPQGLVKIENGQIVLGRPRPTVAEEQDL